MASAYKYWDEFKKKSKPKFEKWIEEEFDAEAANWTQKFAFYITNKTDKQKDEKGNIIKNKDGKELSRDVVTNTKLRKFFGHLKKLELKVKYPPKTENVENNLNNLLASELPLLKARVAYDAGREKDPHHKLVDFYYFIEEALEHTKNKHAFINLIKMLESIVAFVKAYENELFIMDEK